MLTTLALLKASIEPHTGILWDLFLQWEGRGGSRHLLPHYFGSLHRRHTHVPPHGNSGGISRARLTEVSQKQKDLGGAHSDQSANLGDSIFWPQSGRWEEGIPPPENSQQHHASGNMVNGSPRLEALAGFLSQCSDALLISSTNWKTEIGW